MKKLILLFFVILLFSCSKREKQTVFSENIAINKISDETENNIDKEINGENEIIEKKIQQEEIIDQNTSFNKRNISEIFETEDLQALGITSIINFYEIYELLTEEEAKKIEVFSLSNIAIHSFEGTEKFQNLFVIDCTDCNINSFNNIVFSKEYGKTRHCLLCYFCTIKDAASIVELDTLKELNITGCKLEIISELSLSPVLQELHLDECKGYQYCFNTTYPNIESLCLRNNNICEKEELEKILSKCPNVKYIYLGRNPIYEQIISGDVDMGVYNNMIHDSCIQ